MTTTEWILIGGAAIAAYLLISAPAVVPTYASASPLPPPGAPPIPGENGSGGWRGGAGQGSKQTIDNAAVTAANATRIPGAGAVVAAGTKYGPGLSVKLYNLESGVGTDLKATASGAGHALTHLVSDINPF